MLVYHKVAVSYIITYNKLYIYTITKHGFEFNIIYIIENYKYLASIKGLCCGGAFFFLIIHFFYLQNKFLKFKYMIENGRWTKKISFHILSKGLIYHKHI